jgi:hypothetical protein
MPQANVISTAANVTWYTDRAEITALGAGVTYQVYAVGLTTPYGNGETYTSTPVGNIWSNAVSVGANTSVQIYVGAGNKLTVTGTFTAAEIGTTSSAVYGINGAGSNGSTGS